MCHKFKYDGCEVKQEAREKALYWKWKREPAKVYFCLPARECLCVQTALASGIITTDTVILFVERDKEDYNAIKDKLDSLGFKRYYGYCGKFEDCHFDYQGKIDLAFIDLCGEYKAEIGEWLYVEGHYGHSFAKGAIVSVTTQANSRSEGRNAVISRAYRGDMTHHDIVKVIEAPQLVCGAYPANHTSNYCGDYYSAMIYNDLNASEIVHRVLYRSPHKKQNMMVTTVRI